MNDLAYDISHLLEPEMALAEAPTLRIAKAAPAAPTPAGVLATQDALARELMLADDTHEALIQQYLRMSGVSQRDSHDV